MKITDIKATDISLPFQTCMFEMPYGATMGVSKTIVEVYTDEGVVGLGDAWFDPSEEKPERFQQVKKRIVGESPFNLNVIRRKIRDTYFWGGIPHGAYAAIDQACWDIMGKATGKPVYELLGGKSRDRIPFSGYVQTPRYKGPMDVGGEQSPEAVVKLAEHMIDEFGFKVLKFKVGIYPWRQDVEIIRLMRDTFGEDVGLRVDPQDSWTPQQALYACKRLERYNLEYVEDPIDRNDLYNLSLLRRQIKTPLATDGTQFSANPRLFVINAKFDPPAFDIILSSPHYYGGISGARNLAAVCDTLGLGLSMHVASGDFGIATAAVLHIAASQPNMLYACDTTWGSTHHPDQDYTTEDTRFKIEDGCIKVPDKPGLGIELDEDRVKRYHEIFEREGGMAFHFGDPFKPGWWPTVGEQRWLEFPVDEERYETWLKVSKERGYTVEKF